MCWKCFFSQSLCESWESFDSNTSLQESLNECRLCSFVIHNHITQHLELCAKPLAPHSASNPMLRVGHASLNICSWMSACPPPDPDPPAAIPQQKILISSHRFDSDVETPLNHILETLLRSAECSSYVVPSEVVWWETSTEQFPWFWALKKKNTLFFSFFLRLTANDHSNEKKVFLLKKNITQTSLFSPLIAFPS